jgi:type II secretory pathway pseudopilin PulG
MQTKNPLRSELRNGFSLLEVLLVLVCMAAIISWTMHHYQLHERRAETLQIGSEVKSLQRALDTYFHTQGCDDQGIFQNSTTDNIVVPCETLQPYGENIACSHQRLILQYTAQIIKTDQVTKDTPHRPIYQLQIQAVLDRNLTSQEVTWYQQQLQAQQNTGYNLTWISLPTNSYVQMGDESWILNGAGAFFRAVENNRGAMGETPPKYSGSFCAN